MTGNRWWHVFFGATMVVLGALAVSGLVGGDPRQVGALVCLAVLTAAYLAIGRLAFGRRALAWPFLAVVIASSAVAVGFSPEMAIVQSIACPLIWFLLVRTRDAVIGNVVLTVAIAVGFVVSLGASADAVAQAILIEGISLVGSLALGLWISRISDLSAERQRLLDELREAQGQVAALNRDAGVTSERERLARELHDTIAQSLTGLVMLGQRGSRELEAGQLRALRETLGLLEETARETLVDTRGLVAAGAPVELGGGIVAALERLAGRIERETGIVVTVLADTSGRVSTSEPVDESSSVPPGARDRPPPARDVEVVLLRCAQEGLANVRKHSRATRAELILTTDAESVTLRVRDDGIGFDPGQPAEGFGLAGLRARLALAGGILDLQSRLGDGTALTVSVPGGPLPGEPVAGGPVPGGPLPVASAPASPASAVPPLVRGLGEAVPPTAGVRA